MDTWKKTATGTILTICFSRARFLTGENGYSQQKSWQK
jgi:hypothetical protein